MSQLTAHIVYATYAALDEAEKEAFVGLIEKEKKKYRKKPKRKTMQDKLPPIFRDQNTESLVAELMHKDKKQWYPGACPKLGAKTLHRPRPFF